MIPAGYVVTAVMIATVAGVLLGYWLRGTAVESHVEAAAVGDGPISREPERFVPADAPAPEVRERMSDALWWETSVAIHRADCRWARRGTPLEFVWSEAEAKERAEQDGKRGCRHCDPFGVARADTGELEAVSS